MSPYKQSQSAGASSSKRVLNDFDDMDDMDNGDWLQQRYSELAQTYSVENFTGLSVRLSFVGCTWDLRGANVPSQSTLWAPRHTDMQTMNGFDRDAEAPLRSHINTFVEDSVLLNTFMGRGEDMEGSNGASAQDAYGLPLLFEGYIGDTTQMESGMGVLDPPYQLGEAFFQVRPAPCTRCPYTYCRP